MKPIILPGRHIMEDQFILLGLEPMFETPNYEIAFTLNTMGVYFTCYLPANITAFFIVIIGYTEGTMLALSKEIRHLWDDAQQFYQETFNNAEVAINGGTMDPTFKKRVINQFIKERLQKIVVIHTTILNLIHQVEYVFRITIAVEFVLLSAGLIVELLGGLENTYIQMPFTLIQVAWIVSLGSG
ncbi:hypothetical protein evm_008221 [Chilo suppressalis]|nr:hypothetical protein evm_008221 [Chilo suppressalis]